MDNDNIVWRRLKSGNRDALAQLYQRYVRVLYSYGKKITLDEKLIEDSIQDLFVDIWQSRERLSDLETARFYLFRSLRRRIAKVKTRDVTQAISEHEMHNAAPIIDSHETAIILQEESENTSHYVNHLIQNLSGRQEEAIILYFYQDLNYDEIAEILSINEQSARNLIQRALIKMRNIATFAKNPLVLWIMGLLY